MRRGIVAILVVFLVAGCLQQNRDENAPRILSSNPVDGDEQISVALGLLFLFDETLNLGTVGTDTVHLTNEFGTQPGAPSFDLVTNELTFGGTPLDYGTNYRLDLAGLGDTSANLIEPTTINFRTYQNSETRLQVYSDPTTLNIYRDFVLDGFGNIIEEQDFFDPGVDGEFGTADDVQTFLVTHSFTDPHQLDQTSGFFGPGVDTEWGTADDDVAGYTTFTYDAAGRQEFLVDFFGPGVDGIWFNEDDDVNVGVSRTYDANGFFSTETVAGPGALIPFTADDTIFQIVGFTYDETTGVNTRLFVNVGDPGPDMEYLTGDDPGAIYEDYTHDALNREVTFMQYADPGVDGLLLTEDDVLSFGGVSNFDSAGNPTTFDFVDDLGNILQQDQFVSNANGQITDVLSTFDPGPDTEFGTADDVFFERVGTDYDAMGNRTGFFFYDAGVDGLFNTADDFAVQVNTHDTTL